jgi:nucleoid-associated protein YgaU
VIVPERSSSRDLALALARGESLCYLRCVRPLHLPAALLLSAAATLAPLVHERRALAHGGGAAMPNEVPPSPPGDGASAQVLLRDLEATHDGVAKDEEAARVTAEPIKSAKRALERAHGARTAGDSPHARMLDGLALEWAETGRDLARAATAERTAQATGKKAYEAQTKAERARALLEETQARRGRAAAELEHVQAEAKDAARGAADAETQRLGTALEAAKKKATTPKPAAAPKKGAK